MNNGIPYPNAIIHLLQLSDSAFPIGAFSFSNSLESAAEYGIVHDESTLESYTMQIIRSAAMTDGIAALTAWEATAGNDHTRLIAIDNSLWCSKPNEEARQMTQRMGRKLTELMEKIINKDLLKLWHQSIKNGEVTGTHAVTLGIVATLCGINSRELFCSICYGAATIVLGAALRCTRTTHISTQSILFRVGEYVESLYAEAKSMDIEQMNSFSPQCDIMAALHEKGSKRLFMN